MTEVQRCLDVSAEHSKAVARSRSVSPVGQVEPGQVAPMWLCHLSHQVTEVRPLQKWFLKFSMVQA